MMKVLSIINSGYNHAGAKAPMDVIEVLKCKYKDNIKSKTLDLSKNNNKSRIISKILNLLLKISFFVSLKFSNDTNIIQYPVKPIQLLKFVPRKKTIILIHDINGLRYLENHTLNKEIKYFKKFKAIIVHNSKMASFLESKGIDKKKLYILEVFDYIVKKDLKLPNKHNNKLILDFPGNLDPQKCPFIYDLDKTFGFKLNLYGNKVKINNECATYIGSFQPDELPFKMKGNYGLVWDGHYDSADEDVMNKNYTKYNTPHKLSCFISAGIPVIVWEKSAISDFVKRNNIGYIVKSLKDIKNLDTSDYDEKRKNVLKLRQRITNGYYTIRVIEKILKDSK